MSEFTVKEIQLSDQPIYSTETLMEAWPMTPSLGEALRTQITTGREQRLVGPFVKISLEESPEARDPVGIQYAMLSSRALAHGSGEWSPIHTSASDDEAASHPTRAVSADAPMMRLPRTPRARYLHRLDDMDQVVEEMVSIIFTSIRTYRDQLERTKLLGGGGYKRRRRITKRRRRVSKRKVTKRRKNKKTKRRKNKKTRRRRR
jgi:hypothetical protein